MTCKIGIITIVRVNNYGAELQAYATQKVLRDLGYEAEIIDYLFYKHPRHIVTKGSKPLFKNSFKKKITEFLYPRISKYKILFQGNGIDLQRKQRFEAFHTENTCFSKEYRSIEDLNTAVLDYDAYIVGSDQVWNPGNYTSLDPYFLKFAPKGKRRISYASSFGVSALPVETQDYYKQSLGELDFISVREENAVKIVKDVSGRDAQWVLDPTLLMNADSWRKVAKYPEGLPQRYVLLYELTPCADLKRHALQIASDKGCKVVRITKDANRVESDDEVINIMDAGPAEFVGLFEKAEFVLTNSFHGTAFCINLNRPFCVITPYRKDNNSRQKSLLNLFGLGSRLLNEYDSSPQNDFLQIDYSNANKIMQLEREKSLHFLTTAINGYC